MILPERKLYVPSRPMIIRPRRRIVPSRAIVPFGHVLPPNFVVTASTATYNAGSNNFTVPAYHSITFTLNGAGGGGASGGPTGDGTAANNSTMVLPAGTCTSNGGQGGSRATSDSNGDVYAGANGAAGTASGPSGVTCTTGGGASGGNHGYLWDSTFSYHRFGGLGGNGGLCKVTYVYGSAGAPAVGAVIAINCASGGAAGTTAGAPNRATPATAGTDASCVINWS